MPDLAPGQGTPRSYHVLCASACVALRLLTRFRRSKDRLWFVDTPKREGSKAAEIVLREAALEGLRKEQAFAELTARLAMREARFTRDRLRYSQGALLSRHCRRLRCRNGARCRRRSQVKSHRLRLWA